ncbi:uncharacterized protein MELLADRAFT_94780 [Melampsora larici-populina 98AG31]|uniref:Mediator of RNA polymerase II transcription subunit 12 n=1 Tax=Melampsora larici-populina (strain 98AG31 / pathotype 3-4-7) TaxID=747676 RepID=F4S7W4_MELLP|nr:uncharacterized protein MELLADRAFT_94780 [Melampsora larici-populina 98AG31]EGF99284.1 hypothetical protein MELLADRAFT_94780 [Melampsora larici-populina 98AG31]
MAPKKMITRLNSITSSSNIETPKCPTDQDLRELGLNPYQLEPPNWRLPIQLNQPILGYPGLHPTHPGQQEDAITKSLVQSGFSARTLVGASIGSYRIHQTESFSAHQMIYKKLSDDSNFNLSSAGLSALIEARRRYCAINQYDTKSTIKIPGRVTLNDQKRENWLRELADPHVPLLKLSKNVPHGYKGEKLLEMLVQRRVEPVRAVWYIRLIGLNDIIAQRNKNDLMQIKYTITFTSELCQFLQKQLGEVTVPLQLNISSTTSLITGSSRLAGMNVRSKLRSSTLSDPETRKSWVAKFTHTTQILKRLYTDSLLDKPTLFKWLVDQLKLANLAQVHFLLDIHQLVVNKFCLSSNIVRGFVEASLSQIRVINKQRSTSYLSKLELRLKLAVQSSFIICADNFVWPDLWMPNRVLLESIIMSCTSGSDPDLDPLQQNISSVEVKEMLRNDFFSVDWRVSEMVGDLGVGTGPPGNTFTRRAQLVEILDGFSDYHDCSKLYYTYFLNPEPGEITTFKDRIEVLLSWSTTPFRTLDHRVFLTCNILACVKKDKKITVEEFQNHLIAWLEQVETNEGGDMLVRLFSELSRRSIFSYGAYIQRMVAKGDMEDDIMAGKSSGLQTLLREWMPMASTSKASRSGYNHLRRSPGRDAARNGLLSAFSDITISLAAPDYQQFFNTLNCQLEVSKPTSANRKMVTEILPDPVIRMVSDLSSFSSATSTTYHSRSNSPIQLASAVLLWAIQILESCKAYTTLYNVIHSVILRVLDGIDTYEQNSNEQTTSLSNSHIIQSRFCCLHVVCVAVMSSHRIFEIEGHLTGLISQMTNAYVRLRRFNSNAGSTIYLQFVRSFRALIMESRFPDGQILDLLNKDSNEFPAIALLDPNPESSSPITEDAMRFITRDIIQLLNEPSPEIASSLLSKIWEVYGHEPMGGPSIWNSFISGLDIFFRNESALDPSPDRFLQLRSTTRSTVLQFCEELNARSEGGLINCLVQGGTLPPVEIEESGLICDEGVQETARLTSEEGEEREEIDEPTPGHSELHVGPTLSPILQMLYLELVSIGVLSLETVLEEVILKPLIDLPESISRMMTSGEDKGETEKDQAVTRQKVLGHLSDIYDLTHALLLNHSPFEVGRVGSEAETPIGAYERTISGFVDGEARNYVEIFIDRSLSTWKLKSERYRWLEQSPAGPAFYSRLVLSLLLTMKGLLDLMKADDNDATMKEDVGQGEIIEDHPSPHVISSNRFLRELIESLERFRIMITCELAVIKRVINHRADLILDPLLEFLANNNTELAFNNNMVRTIDDLLPYSLPTDLVSYKYPYLESIFKSTCIFTHGARTRQFQLHLRLLLSGSPPQIDDKPPPTDVNSVLGPLVEVLARKLHLTDSKEPSPLFLSHLLPAVAEAVVIKLSAYLGISIFKLVTPSQQDPDYEISRIHHICRCITELTHQLTNRTFHMNGDVVAKSIGGTGQLMCNATLDSYLSYWNQLKNGITTFGGKFIENAYTDHNSGLKQSDSRTIRSLLHSIQVMLWALPGLVSHLGSVKFTISELLVDIAMCAQAQPSLMTQIMDTVGVLLFPSIPDDMALTSAVGVMRKRLRWLHIPISHLEAPCTDILPMDRLKYILGSSLRGTTTTFQERPKDGWVKLVEEKSWEELEKMDPVGPAFISIDALKCQTLSQVEVVPEGRRNTKNKMRSEQENVIRSATTDDSKTNDGMDENENNQGGQEDEDDEEDEEIVKGDRENFEHELNTDVLSTMPLHFLRSLYPSRSRLEGTYQVHAPINHMDLESARDHQTRLEIQTLKRLANEGMAMNSEPDEPNQSTSGSGGKTQVQTTPIHVPAPTRKRKIGQNELAAVHAEESILEPEDPSTHNGPTLRSTRSTRRKSTAIAPPPVPAPSNKRSKRR